MNKNILHRTRRNEARTAAPKKTAPRSSSLHAQTSDHEQGFGRVAFPENEPEDQAIGADADGGGDGAGVAEGWEGGLQVGGEGVCGVCGEVLVFEEKGEEGEEAG